MERDEIDRLLAKQLQEVLALDSPPPAHARLDDLQADSLDLVEVVEGVETALAARGVAVSLSERSLRAIVTVADAGDALHAAIEDVRTVQETQAVERTS